MIQRDKRINAQHNERTVEQRLWQKPSEKLAESLEVLHELQNGGVVAIRSGDLTRTHRERLTRNSFLQEVIKGWYVPGPPGRDGGGKRRLVCCLLVILRRLSPTSQGQGLVSGAGTVPVTPCRKLDHTTPIAGAGR